MELFIKHNVDFTPLFVEWMDCHDGCDYEFDLFRDEFQQVADMVLEELRSRKDEQSKDYVERILGVQKEINDKSERYLEWLKEHQEIDDGIEA